MPVHCSIVIPRLNRAEFGPAAFGVMGHVFAIHRDFGCLFEEDIYKTELARRLPEAHIEVPIDVTHGTFSKRYFLDLLASEGALFELKTVSELGPRHRAQLLNYLHAEHIDARIDRKRNP